MDLINRLPDEILERVFGYLEAEDLAKSSIVCRRFCTIAGCDFYWKILCGINWNITELPNESSTWRDSYVDMHRRYGPYIKCYNRVNRCWEKIFAVTQFRAPQIYNSLLRDGISEDRLNKVQKGVGGRFPLEYRCSYRICNGQSENNAITASDSFAGLFGGYDEEDSGDYFCGWVNENSQASPHYANCTVIRHCCLSLVVVIKRCHPCMQTHGGVALCIRDSSSQERAKCQHDVEHERLNGRMVSTGSRSPNGTEFFIYSNSFIEYLEDFAEKLSVYPVVNNRFLKYNFNSVGDTGPYKVTVRTAFFRERSVAMPTNHRTFHFFYRITMSMHEDALKSDSCQLETRHWIITNADGDEETVNGPGVVGSYPVLRPGSEFTWISRTSYTTVTGTMHGHFTMHKLGTGTEVVINCPVYKMEAPEFVVC